MAPRINSSTAKGKERAAAKSAAGKTGPKKAQKGGGSSKKTKINLYLNPPVGTPSTKPSKKAKNKEPEVPDGQDFVSLASVL